MGLENYNADELVLKRELDGYLSRATSIRGLITPSIDEAGSPEGYRSLYIKNFQKHLKLYSKNSEVMEKVVMPLLSIRRDLTGHEPEILREFALQLQDGTGIVYADTSFLWRLSKKLYEDACTKNDLDYLVEQINLHLIACNGKMILEKSLPDGRNAWDYYYNEAEEVVQRIFHFLDPEEFSKIKSEHTRELLLVNSRHFCFVYAFPGRPEGTNEMVFKRLVRSYELASDPFYTEKNPDYNWHRHKVKCLVYISQLTQRNNEEKYSPELCKEILRYVEELLILYEEDPDTTEDVISRRNIALAIEKAKYFAGEIDAYAIKRTMFSYYKKRQLTAHNEDMVYSNFQLPSEYLGFMKRNRLTEQDIDHIETVYRGVINDAFTLPNNDTLTVIMEHFSRILSQYIEIPGGYRFRDFCLNFLAAVYPRIYIHSLSTADIARCLCNYLIDRRPDLFLGILGCKDREDVRRKKEEICTYAHNAGLCHDFGVIPLLPILKAAERPKFPEDDEYRSRQGLCGYKISNHSISTLPYINIILGEKRNYDDIGDYDGMCTWDIPEKTILDIVSAADFLDYEAAKIERESKKPSVKKILPRLKDLSGTVYAPYVEKVLKVVGVQEDIDYLISEGRKRLFHETYTKLKEIRDRGSM